MATSLASDLASAFYSLSELEFLQPRGKFPAERLRLADLLEKARVLPAGDFHSTSRELVRVASAFCHDDSLNAGALFRAFDGIDALLDIDYREISSMMPATGAGERLYENGGVGVQTSYSTILRVLERLQLPMGAHLIDLGSGFGRVGLAAGLFREDLRFTGYEFVGHRVNASNASALKAGLAGRIDFFQQDLSDGSFLIPSADAYYLYDPFSDSTYELVLARLAELGRERKISVIAKDAARVHFQRWANLGEWEAPEAVDEGSIWIYRSRVQEL